MSVILLFDSLILIYLFNNDRKFCFAIPFPHFKMSSPRMENENNHFEAKILIEKASNLHHSKMSLHLKTLSIFCIFIVCPPPSGGLFEVTPSPLHGHSKQQNLIYGYPWSVAMEIAEYCITFSLFFFFPFFWGGGGGG